MNMWREILTLDQNCGGIDQSYPYLRVYGKNGEQYPRLIVDITNVDGRTWISVNQKENNQDFWRTERLPNELLEDFEELLKKYIKAIHNQREPKGAGRMA